ncbi:MAG: holo-ACP synthase [Phycisphaerae bacterium]|jgi:holo-[acyl-carrier protein] synthase
MKIAHGIDLTEISRIEEMLEKHGEHFLARCYTDSERKYAGSGRKTAERLAARFAAKEAVFKLVGTGLRGKMSWRDVEVVNDGLGKPAVSLSGETARIAVELGITEITISLTHTKQHAMASAVAIIN